MTARVIPFPTVARPRELARIIKSVAAAPPEKAQACLVNHMTGIVKRLDRAQVRDTDIQRDLVALEAAVWSRIPATRAPRGGIA